MRGQSSVIWRNGKLFYLVHLIFPCSGCNFDTMPVWFGALIAFLWSPFKFMFGVASAFLTQGLHPLLGFALTCGGAMLGVLVYVYAGEWLLERWLARRRKRRVFSKGSRRLVRIRKSGGLWGVALLTPVLLSIPVGCILAITMEHHRMRIVRMMFVSIAAWGVLIFGLKLLLDIDITRYFGEIKP